MTAERIRKDPDSGGALAAAVTIVNDTRELASTKTLPKPAGGSVSPELAKGVDCRLVWRGNEPSSDEGAALAYDWLADETVR